MRTHRTLLVGVILLVLTLSVQAQNPKRVKFMPSFTGAPNEIQIVVGGNHDLPRLLAQSGSSTHALARALIGSTRCSKCDPPVKGVKSAKVEMMTDPRHPGKTGRWRIVITVDDKLVKDPSDYYSFMDLYWTPAINSLMPQVALVLADDHWLVKSARSGL
jgi:hypothetical protein